MKNLLATILFLTLLLGGGTVSAQTTTSTAPLSGEYTVLAPLPGTTKQCTGSGADQTCTADINSYLKGFLGLVIGIGAVIAMIMLGFYGFQYATSDSASVKMENKGKLWEIVQGLLLIISAYAIIYTINPALLAFSLEITAPKITVPPVATTSVPGGAVTGRGQTYTQNPDPSGDAVVRNRLTNGTGITINRTNPCALTQKTGCTSLTQLPETAITGLLALNSSCRCNLMITGGTETLPHNNGVGTEHGPNLPVVDLNPSTKLNTYLGIPDPKERSNTTIMINNRRATFTFEKAGGNASHSSTGDHWHVVFE